MELQVIELTIDDIELDRVEAIAFVDNPAIQRNWIAFNSDEFIKPEGGQSQDDWMGVCVPHYIGKGDEQDQAVAKCISIYDQYKFKSHKFQTADEEKRIVAGPLMVADMPIYRNFEGKEFFVKFSASTIEQIVNKFMKEGRINAFNKMHNDADKLDGVYLQQSFIIDSTKGINTPMGFEAMADGSWFGFVKVDNDQVWSDFVKTGQLKGFSVEGNFSEKNKFNSDIMTKIEQFMEKLSKKLFSEDEKVETTTEEKTEVAMGSAKLADGTMVMWEGELAEGVAVMLEGGMAAPDGEHTFEDGTVIAIEGGIVTAVKKPEGESEMAAPAPEFAAEIEALKLQVSELHAKIEASKPADYSAQVTKIEETQKLMFETIQAFIESKDDTATKDKFKKANLNVSKLGERAQSFLASKQK